MKTSERCLNKLEELNYMKMELFLRFVLVAVVGKETIEHLLVSVLLEETSNGKDVVVAYIYFGNLHSCGGRSQNKDLQMPKALEVVFMKTGFMIISNHEDSSKQFPEGLLVINNLNFQQNLGKHFTVNDIFSDSPSFSGLLLFKGVFYMCLSSATL